MGGNRYDDKRCHQQRHKRDEGNKIIRLSIEDWPAGLESRSRLDNWELDTNIVAV